MQFQPELIGKRIRKERVARHLTQKKLAKMVNISGKQISNYENGRAIPPQEMLLRLAAVFECDTGYLLGEEGYEEGTKLDTAICNSLGLSIGAVKAIRRATSAGLKQELEGRRKGISAFFESPWFGRFIDRLVDAHRANDEVCAYADKANSDLSATFGEEIVAKAFSLLIGPDELPTGDDYDPKVAEAYMALNDKIDKIQDAEYALKVARYELRESFELIVNSLFR